MAALTTKPFQIYLREGQLEALRLIAKRHDQPVAELVRQGVDMLLATMPIEEDPLMDIVGMFDSGLGDVAAQHDHYLYKSCPTNNSRWLCWVTEAIQRSESLPLPAMRSPTDR